MTRSAQTQSTASDTQTPEPTPQKFPRPGKFLTEPVETIGVAFSSTRQTTSISGSLTALWRRVTNTLTPIAQKIKTSVDLVALLGVASFLMFTVVGVRLIEKVAFYDYLAFFAACLVYGLYTYSVGWRRGGCENGH